MRTYMLQVGDTKILPTLIGAPLLSFIIPILLWGLIGLILSMFITVPAFAFIGWLEADEDEP